MGSRLRFRTRLRAGGTGGVPFDPLSVFQDGTDGLYINFATMENLFQESTAQTAVTVAAQSVGYVLESHAWAGKSLSQEIIDLSNLVAVTPVNGASFPFSTYAVSGSDITSAIKNPSGFAGASWDSGGSYPIGSFFSYSINATINSGTSPDVRLVISSSGAASSRSNAVTLANGANAGRLVSITATNSRYFQIGGANTLYDFSVSSPSLKWVPGNHGLQATSGARPTWQTTLARFDGADDNFLTTLNPSAAFTMMVKMKANATDDIAMGARATTDTRALLGTNPSGQLGGGVGADGSTVITGGSSITGATGVAALMYNGTTVKLYWNGAEIYSGAQNGTPATTIPIRVGAFNDNGTAVFPIDGDLFYALAIQKALTPTEIANISTAWA